MKMAVSANVQRGMRAKQAAVVDYVATRREAEDLQADWRRSGQFRRVQIYTWNNGTRESPRTEYKVMAWT
jgi:hypothetical protein